MKQAIGSIILAAGLSSRFRRASVAPTATKLIAPFCGAPLIRHCARVAQDFQPCVVVTGWARAEVLEALQGLNFLEAHNPAPERGLSSSLKLGLAALPDHAAAAVIFLGDMPLARAALCRALIDAFLRRPDVDAVIPAHHGRRGHPVLLSRALFPELAKLEGDAGAGALLQRPNCKTIEAPIDDEAIFFDMDLEEDAPRGAAIKRRRMENE